MISPTASASTTRQPIDLLMTAATLADPATQARRIGRVLRGRTRDDELRVAVAGKRVLVTGGSAGVGRAVALACGRAGAEVIVLARRQELLDEVVAEIIAVGGRAAGYSVDLADEDATTAIAREILARHGGVDVLVNNAGRSIRRLMVDTADRLHDYDRVMTLNFFGMLWITMPIVDHMRRRGGCHVVNVSSVATQVMAQTRFTAYAASKNAMDGFARAAAPETRRDGVTWTTVQLPLVRTAMIAPSKQLSAIPALSPEAGADMVLDGIVRKPTWLAHPLWNMLGHMNRTTPRLLDRLMSYDVRPTPKAPLPIVAVIGAGVSGIAMGMALQDAGDVGFRIFEKADRPGGTWRENTYPGLTCDVPSHFYAFRDAPNPRWSRLFSPGTEIQRYLVDVVEDRGLAAHISYGSEVVSATYRGGGWRLVFADGTTSDADVVVCATGTLHHPAVPDIPGRDSFAGPSFHSARWDDDVDLADKQVGIIGSGSTGVQLTAALSKTSQVTLFQRTPHWVATVPNPSLPQWFSTVIDMVPGAQRGLRDLIAAAFDNLGKAVIQDGVQRRLFSGFAARSLAEVDDATVKSALHPDYPPGCKRLIFSPDFYAAVIGDAVELITEGIAEIVAGGVRTTDGVLHELDVLVFATGFDATAFMRPMNITGRDGVTLEDAWREDPKAHLATTIPGFPNLFMILGPRSPLGNTSIVGISETQSAYIVRWLERMRDRGLAEVEVTEEATRRRIAGMRAAFGDTVWTAGCNSWYLGPDGTPLLWPWTMARYRSELAELPVHEFAERTQPDPS